MRLARAGDPGRAMGRCQAQSRGRGRRGRQWASPPGNLYASLFAYRRGAATLARRSSVSSLALRWHVLCANVSAMTRAYGSNGRMTFSLTAPSSPEFCWRAPCCRMAVSACIMGIGVNCAAVRAVLPYRATALAQIARAQDRRKMCSWMLSAELCSRGLERFAGAAASTRSVPNGWLLPRDSTRRSGSILPSGFSRWRFSARSMRAAG